MINSIFRGIGSGFGRSIGRILGLLFIGFIIYLLLKYFNIDIKDIIHKGGYFL